MKSIHRAVLLLILVLAAALDVRADGGAGKFTFVIVHGATAGGWEWKKVGEFLTADGHTVYRPTLTGLGERVHLSTPAVDLDTHINDVVNTILYENLHDVVLVGHSYGGMVITGVMDRVPDRIRHVVFLDAAVPDDGMSLYDLFGGPRANANVVDGMLQVPWVKPGASAPHSTPQSVKTFTQPVSYKNPLAKALPVTYVAFVPADQSAAERAAKDKSWQRAVARGWTIRTFPGHHVAHVENPRGVATLLEDAVRDLNQPGVEKPAAAAPEPARVNFARPIVLAPDDVRAFPEAPAGFKAPRPGVPSGRIELFEYDSAVTHTRRQANVYLPPGYSPDRKYPVLYLLHGIGGDITEWLRAASPNVVLDNLIAEGKAVPMIVVLPNGRALPDDRPGPNVFAPEQVAGFTRFEGDLLDNLIPAIQAKYPTLDDREHRALAGLSMGGGQTLNIGFGHLDAFAWLGAFSCAPNTKPPAELVPDPVAAREKLRLIYLSCGNKDGLINFSQGVHRYLKEHGVPHVWNVDDHGHDGETWAGNLYYFVQNIFR